MKTMKHIRTVIGKVLACAAVLTLAVAQTAVLTGCTREESKSKKSKVKPSVDPGEGNGGYLFAHMNDMNYGSLFYSISRDGVEWKTLNSNKVILDGYYGHPDLCEGPDVFGNSTKRWYMIGVVRGSSKEAIVLWHSTDLVVWKNRLLDGANFVVDHLGVYNEIPFVGAPKMFYDEVSGQFLITWHAGEYYKQMKEAETPEEAEEYQHKNWETMKTCYTLTRDFRTFTRPKRFFASQTGGDLAPIYFTGADANISTIDVIIRKYAGKYYAILKDERWNSDEASSATYAAPATYKTVRIASSNSLLGPYTLPVGAGIVSPHWREAPTLVVAPDGKFRMFYEDYSFHKYEMRESTALQGATWTDVAINPPKDARHGCIVWLDEDAFQHVVRSF